MAKIPLSYYQNEDVVALSRALLGKYLYTCLEPENQVTGGMIIETEAYQGPCDKASHAYNNRRTKRTETMFLPGGVAYIYLCYGIHYLFNIITNQEDIPHAILIRAIRPEIGIDIMLRRRKKEKMNPQLTKGPGSLCQALGISKAHNGIALDGNKIWLEEKGIVIPSDKIVASTRIGIDYAEEDAFKLWRFYLE